MNYAVHTIQISMKPFPIYHSDYIAWTILLASTSKKNKDQFFSFYRAVLSLANEDWIPENLDIRINGEILNAHNVFSFDLGAATRDIKAGKYERETDIDNDTRVYRHMSKDPVALVKQEKVQDIGNFVAVVQNYVANLEGDESFYYYAFPVTEDVLFVLCNDESGNCCKRIREELLPYLRYLDLSKISFKNADVRGKDLSYTNIANLKIDELHKRSANGTNLTGVVLAGDTIRSCDLKKAVLKETFASIEVPSNEVRGMIYDATVILLDDHDNILPNNFPERRIRCLIHF